MPQTPWIIFCGALLAKICSLTLESRSRTSSDCQIATGLLKTSLTSVYFLSNILRPCSSCSEAAEFAGPDLPESKRLKWRKCVFSSLMPNAFSGRFYWRIADALEHIVTPSFIYILSIFISHDLVVEYRACHPVTYFKKSRRSKQPSKKGKQNSGLIHELQEAFFAFVPKIAAPKVAATGNHRVLRIWARYSHCPPILDQPPANFKEFAHRKAPVKPLDRMRCVFSLMSISDLVRVGHLAKLPLAETQKKHFVKIVQLNCEVVGRRWAAAWHWRSALGLPEAIFSRIGPKNRDKLHFRG